MHNLLPWGRWVKVLSTALAALVLAPVPVLGFTFLGNWSFFDGPFDSVPVVPTAGDSANGGFLSLDLGFNPRLAPSTTSIVATRNFRIGNSGEALQLTQAFEALLLGSSLNVLVEINKVSGSAPIPFSFITGLTERAGSRFRSLPLVVGGNTTNSIPLAGPGDYNVTIIVSFRRNRFSSLDTNPPRLVSPYTFTFQGI